jgi:hypothetical protein
MKINVHSGCCQTTAQPKPVCLFSRSPPNRNSVLRQKIQLIIQSSLQRLSFAGISRSECSNSDVYGPGAKGFAYRYGITYADQVTSDYFPEAIIPALFYDDPRYFRKSEGSIKSRAFYAIDHIFIGRTDTGAPTFNAPEILGNGLAAIAGMSYHSHERTAGDALSEFGTLVRLT